MSNLFIVLTSASVGALAASLITLIGQVFERKSRKKELMLSKAIELSLAKINLAKQLAIANRQPTVFSDPVMMTAIYYKDLNSIFKTGDITKKSRADHQKSVDEVMGEKE